MTLAEKIRNTNDGSSPLFARNVLDWYDRHHRRLPWRVTPEQKASGIRPDPYRVWLSEIMLQQTTVASIRPYFEDFVTRWPDVDSLARADGDDIMKAWAGLGYYSRARNLKRCAEIVAFELGGRFPDTEHALLKLPGIGAYTAAAIAAIAFDRPAVVVDGNIERVTTRHQAIETPLPAAKPAIRAFVAENVPADRPGDFAQALMDIGALICTPKNPSCGLCPIRSGCRAAGLGAPAKFPVKMAKAEKPLRGTAAFVAVRPDGAVWLRKRPEKGLLGGMTEVPTSHFTAREDGDRTVSAAPFAGRWKRAGTARHVFTHFRLEVDVFRSDDADGHPAADGWWSPPRQIGSEALPTVMRKILAAAGIDTPARASVRAEGSGKA